MDGHILSVTAIAEPFPDGQKVSAAAVEYDRVIDGGRLSPALFRVKDRTITRVYAGDLPERAEEGKNGAFVIIELSLRDREAPTLPEPERPHGPGGHGGPGQPDGHSGPFHLPPKVRKEPRVVVTQAGDVAAAGGEVIPACPDEAVSGRASQPVIEDFRQFEYGGIPYNLFVPRNYDRGGPYPLVMFIPDAGPMGDDPLLTLVQGNGAVVWAMPEEQAKHECFVLAPQIPKRVHLVNDYFEAAPELEVIREMLEDVVGRYDIDRNRLYATGQSMGCMASCELNIRYPGLFAASLLVAGQWSPERMAEKCTECNMWILVSEGDLKAFPGMNAVTGALEAAGARVGRYRWDGRADPEQAGAAVKEALADDVNIRYTVFEDSTVVPEWEDVRTGSNHLGTWPVVYAIEGLRDWLFSCRKTAK